MILAVIIILGILSIFFKITYAVTLDGVEIGYTSDKNALQERINGYIQTGDGSNLAFILVDHMPEYHLCFVKKDAETNDEEIYQTIISQGTSYYKFYALVEDDEEKYYLSSRTDAEEVINQLKEKNSKNKDDISIKEKYDLAQAEYTSIDDAVDGLYQKRVTYSSGYAVGASGANTSGPKIDIPMSLVKPCYGILTSPFYWRWGRMHKGIDIGSSQGRGTPIYAAADGTVIVSQYGYSGGYGNYIMIDHGSGVTTLYGHCDTLAVSVGQHVSAGQYIAGMGSTGSSTGNHLHFEVRVNNVAQNPLYYVSY